ncbi:MAG: hypothetical protein ACR2HY_04640 [Acidimicrobiales bacterium]
MTDDELTELLRRTLDPGHLEPPPERVAAFRAHVVAHRHDAQEPTHPSPALPPTGNRRAGWWAAAAAAVAAITVVASLTVPAVMGHRGGTNRSGVASEGVVDTRQALGSLRAALLSQDPVEVARADSELLGRARPLSGPERSAIEDEAMKAHVEAVHFLRDHPLPDALAAIPPASTPSPAPSTTLSSVPVQPSTTVVAPQPASSTPTTAPVPRSVAITAVTPTLDGPFTVAFTTSGFTPDANAYSIRFSFDGGQDPVAWAGPSPWSLPLAQGIRYHQVCARVVDATGAEEHASGNCVAIS